MNRGSFAVGARSGRPFERSIRVCALFCCPGVEDDDLTIVPGSLIGLKILYLRGTDAGATRSFFQHFPHLTNLEQLLEITLCPPNRLRCRSTAASGSKVWPRDVGCVEY